MKKSRLTEFDRYKIEALRKAKVPVKEIARILNKSENCIYYELRKGKVMQRDYLLRDFMIYKADVGQRITNERKKKTGCKSKIQKTPELMQVLSFLLGDKRYSPYCVQVILKRDYGIALSDSTIYTWIKSGFIPGITKNSLAYKKNKKKDPVRRLVCAKNVLKPSISDRPDIKNKNLIGHWEMDTVYSGKNCSKKTLLVLSEIVTKKEQIFLIPDRSSSSVVNVFDQLEKRLGKELFRETYKSITVDNGVEFSDYDNLVKNGRTLLFYCHPYSSWERGLNENQNKLIRRWIPKGDDIGLYSSEEIQKIEDWINDIPRKIFGGLSARQYAQKIS